MTSVRGPRQMGSRFALDRPGPDLYVDSPRPQHSNELLIEIVAGIVFCGIAGANQDRKQDEQAQNKGPKPMVSMSPQKILGIFLAERFQTGRVLLNLGPLGGCEIS